MTRHEGYYRFISIERQPIAGHQPDFKAQRKYDGQSSPEPRVGKKTSQGIHTGILASIEQAGKASFDFRSGCDIQLSLRPNCTFRLSLRVQLSLRDLSVDRKHLADV
jgi:hypothetical protein